MGPKLVDGAMGAAGVGMWLDVLQSRATSSASAPSGLYDGGLLSRISYGLAPVLLGGSRVGSRSHRHGKREAQRAVQRGIYDDGNDRRMDAGVSARSGILGVRGWSINHA